MMSSVLKVNVVDHPDELLLSLKFLPSASGH
jgi:hypothetical protein